ncbi:hypothetical protein ACGTN6_00955 [Halomonas sp. THAF12]|uniref:Lipoprotein n=1 Tax=Halomonas organivorans TaxID=257772 RepID=A0A7W5BW63_9GAMM|nr:hypothetical protein [Halomonas organivorans]MBB3140219.1 hypothetical protein [Halomonas organivorans]
MKKIILAAAASLTLAGCAGPSVMPPNTSTGNQTEAYSADFDSVWEGAVDWFAVNNIPIKNIEKDSGIIGSEYTLGANYSQIDCGTVNPGAMHILLNQNVVANINVLVRETSAGTTVQPNVFGHGTAMLRDNWNGMPVQLRLDNCVSTGELERSLHQYLSRSL